MDALKGAFNNFAGGNKQNNQNQQQQNQGYGGQGYQGPGYHGQPQEVAQNQGSQGGGSFFGNMGNKLNAAAGGGPESEKNEDYLDKGVDYVQEHFLGQGPQNNESAIEQAKDEQISDFIRSKYKSTTGKDFFIKDKETRFG